MTTETVLGTLVVEESNDPAYPGFYLSIRRDVQTISICLLEVSQDNPLRPELKAHIWSPEAIWEDPAVSMSWSKEEVDRMFEEE